MEECFFNLRYPFRHDEGPTIRDSRMEDCTAQSEYFMTRSQNPTFRGVRIKGKYSFQCIENAVFENCAFDTKDAFWHGEIAVGKACRRA